MTSRHDFDLYIPNGHIENLKKKLILEFVLVSSDARTKDENSV